MCVGVGVVFLEAPMSVHEERLEEMEVLGVLLPPNLSAMGSWGIRWGTGGTGTGNLSSSLVFFDFFRLKKDSLRFADASER